MSFSVENKYYKVLFTLSIVFLLFSTTRSASDFVDLPLKIPGGSSTIHATLTDVYGSKKYSLQEYISASGPSTRGKIVISGEKDSYNIHYATIDNGVDTKERLIIYGTNCLIFTHRGKWEQNLPGINKPLLNSLLLMGPSILYRIDHSSHVWKSAQEKNIRGTMMKGATTQIDYKFKITFYYKKHFDEKSGIENPSRIEISNGESAYDHREYLVLDVYLKNEDFVDQLQNEVQPQPGIGCPIYLSERKTMPILKALFVHYFMYEYIQGSTNTRTISEIYATEYYRTLRLKSNLLGETTEVIYDYQFGVSLLVNQGGSCSIASIDSDAPGINSYGYFTLQELFFFDQTSKYLGKRNMEHGLSVDLWESVKYNITINGKKTDKAVITQYFAESRNSKVFSGYTLTSTMITTYKYDSLKKVYTLADKITRDYMNIENTESDAEFLDFFSLKDCKYLSSAKKITLNFKLACDDSPNLPCTKSPRSKIYKLKRDSVRYVILSQKISPLRVDNVEFRLANDQQIEMEVTLLDLPDLQYIFTPKVMSVSSDTFDKMSKITAKNALECLDKLSTVIYQIKIVIYRPSDSICGYLLNSEYLKEDAKHGQPCNVYHFPLHNLDRIKQEIPLDKLHDTFLKYLGRYIYLSNGNSSFGYKIIDVIDVKQAESRDLATHKASADTKLKVDDRFTVTVPDVKTFADCYRACRKEEQLSCNTFSFCQTDDSIDCRVSSLEYYAINETHMEHDKKCSIFSFDFLKDYSEARYRKFKTQFSAAVRQDLSNCAALCHASPDCSSFQYCDYSCSFGGFYTDSATEYDERCSIYYPKVSEKYQKTGDKIVSDVMYTEMNLNLDQCASLCHGWSDGDTGCISFNYCPKSRTESSCSLTKFSVKSSDTKTTEGSDCTNYELKVESREKKNKELSSTKLTKGISGSDTFGIIVLFLLVGSSLGLIAPFVYSNLKKMRNNSGNSNQSFTWTRQVDTN